MVIVAGTVEKLCWWCSSFFRGGFSMKLLKLKLQGSSLVWAPFKALGGARNALKFYSSYMKETW